MGDFDLLSRFNKEAGVQLVRFGQRRPVLEVELNELQQLFREKLRETFLAIMPDGELEAPDYDYSDGTFTVENGKFSVNGELVIVTSLSLAAANGDTIYLDTWDMTVEYLDTLKKFGNQQEIETVENWFYDDRIDVETTKRTVLAYNLSTTNVTEGHSFLKLGRISGGQFIKEVINIKQSTKEELEWHLIENAPHQYGERFELRYNSITDSLDLVVIE